MKLTTKKEIIYVALAFFTAIGSQTWFELAYNDPSFVKEWVGKDWLLILCLSSVPVIAQTLIAWKAFLSDPNEHPQPKETE